MNQADILTRIGTALAIGFLIGVERGWRERDEGEGERAAGLRTFSLIGLSGGIWGTSVGKPSARRQFAAQNFSLRPAVAITLYRWRETEREGDVGATTQLIAALLTFRPAAPTQQLAIRPSPPRQPPIATSAVLLSAKNWLHAWVRSGIVA